MFFVDDIVMSPFKGFLFLAKEVANAVEQEKESRRDALMTELTELHRLFEKGELSDEDFDTRESVILDLLDQFNE